MYLNEFEIHKKNLLDHTRKIEKNPLKYQQAPSSRHAPSISLNATDNGTIWMKVKAINTHDYKKYNLEYEAQFKGHTMTVTELIRSNLPPKMVHSTINLVTNDNNNIINESSPAYLYSKENCLIVKLQFIDSTFTQYIQSNLARICNEREASKNSYFINLSFNKRSHSPITDPSKRIRSDNFYHTTFTQVFTIHGKTKLINLPSTTTVKETKLLLQEQGFITNLNCYMRTSTKMLNEDTFITKNYPKIQIYYRLLGGTTAIASDRSFLKNNQYIQSQLKSDITNCSNVAKATTIAQLPEDLDKFEQYTCNTENELRIFQYNVRGYKRLQQNQEMNSILAFNPHLIILQESKNLNNLQFISNFNQIQLPNANLHHKQHLYVHKSISALKTIYMSNNTYIFRVNDCNLAFIYIPYELVVKKDLEGIKSILAPAITHRATIIGDLNFNILELSRTTDAISKSLVKYLNDHSYNYNNQPQHSMQHSNNLLDHCWSHSSNFASILSHTVYQQPETFTSDHFPSLIRIGLATPIIAMEKVNWQKLKLPLFKRKFKRILQKLIHKFEHQLSSKSLDTMDNTLQMCILTAGRLALGMIPNNPTSVYHGSTIVALNKYIITKQRKFNRTKSKNRRIKLIKDIKKLKKEYNKAVEQQVFQKQLAILDELSKSSTLAYHKICNIKNNTIRAREYCELSKMLAFQKNHFKSTPHSWNKLKRGDKENSNAGIVANSLFTRKIVENELKHLNMKKASGGLIPVSAFKFLPSNGIKMVQRIFVYSYITGEIPISWSESGIVEIFKNKGTVEDPMYFRPVSLLMVLRKVYEKILYYNRLKDILIPSHKQHGFCSSRGTLTQLHYVCNLIKMYNSMGDVYMASLDLSSAFDKINWDDIFEFCKLLLNNTDLNALRSLIVNQKLYLLRDNNKNMVDMEQGIPQGGTLSPLIFSFIIDKVLSKLEYDSSIMALCLYADDIFIISSNPQYLEDKLNEITDLLISYSFKANPTKYQVVASIPITISIKNNIIQQTDNMRYLGIHLNHKGVDYNAEISHKRQKLAFIQSKVGPEVSNVLFHGKSLFVKGVTESILSYGISLWDRTELYRIERIRREAINRLFGNTRLVHEYLCMFYSADELYLKSRISHENQIRKITVALEQIDTPAEYIEILKRNTSFAVNDEDIVDLEVESIEDLKLRSQNRLDIMWNANPAIRSCNIKTDSNLMILLRKNRFTYTYTHHVLRLGVQYLMGKLPFRFWNEKKLCTVCSLCLQPYDSLDHFYYECTNNKHNLNREKINHVFKVGNEKEIFDLLKLLKKVTVVSC